jgi:hypothetical protein
MRPKDNPRPNSAQGSHHRFGPHVVKLAQFLAAEFGGDLVEVIVEVDRRYPGLSFHDFMGATVLAEAIALKPQGRA